MNWSSVKNLLIAILIGANLFMLYNIARQDRTRNYIDEDEITNAVELLAERGLVVPVSSIPLRKFKAPIYESFYDASYHESVANALTGADVPLYMQPDNGLSGTTPDGIYVKFDPEFGFIYAKNDKFDLSTYTDVTADNFKIMAQSGSELPSSRSKDMIASATAFLSSRTADDSMFTVDVVNGYYDSTSGLSYLLAYQLIDEFEIYSHYAVCVFDEDELIGVHGRWYFASLDDKYDTELQNQVNILFTDLETLKGDLPDQSEVAIPSDTDFDATFPIESFSNNLPITSNSLNTGFDIPQVVSMSNCYVIYWNSDKTALYFIPAWQITHIGGNTIVYNAANGTVYSRN